MLSEAKRLGMWLICPPPNPLEPSDSAGFASPGRPIGAEYEPVLAWDFGSGLSEWDALATRQWADQIRAADRAEGRPLVCRPESGLRTFSRYVDVLLLGRPVLGSGLELTDFGRWLRERPRLARPGTPIWTTVQTQPSPSLAVQWAALASGEPLPTAFSGEQIRLMAYTAITSGSRGLLFESETPLDAADPATRGRAMLLELLNLELSLAEPWLAAGSYVETVPGSEPEVLAAVLETDRARLLVPIWSAANAQRVAGRAAGNRVSFTVPGVPEEYRPYLLTAGGMEPLRRNRETGGVRVILDEFGLTAIVLLTQDPLIVNSLAQRSAQMARRAAELRRELAAAKLQSVPQVHARLIDTRSPSPEADHWLAEARRSLQSCDRLLAARDYSAAYLEAERAMRPLRMVERTGWQAATAAAASPLSSPAAATFDTLPLGRNLAARLASAGGVPNALVGGDFEDLGGMLAAGWVHVERSAEQLHSTAELSPQAARSGRLGLRLAVRPQDPKATDIVVEMPPAWITSAPVYAEAGQWLVIRGWVQVPHPIAGSVDGLLIIESLTGEVLAERVGETAGWEEFVLYRAAPRSGNVTVTFAMSGIGEAWVDDVTIQCLDPAATNTTAQPIASRPVRLPPVGTAGWR